MPRSTAASRSDQPPFVRSSSPLSRRSASTSSTKNGFPSAWPATSSSARDSSGAASAASTSSVTSCRRGVPGSACPLPGTPACSGRMVASTRTGPSASESTRSSTSISGSAAQCRSSMISTAGPPAPSCEIRRTHWSCSRRSAARGSRSPATSRPSVRPRISRPASRSNMSSAESSWRRPSSCRSTSASAL